MASLLTSDVMNLLVGALPWQFCCAFQLCQQQHERRHALAQANGAVRPIVRKKAATCLLRLIRKSPAEAETLQPDVWSVKLVRQRPWLFLHCLAPLCVSLNAHRWRRVKGHYRTK